MIDPSEIAAEMASVAETIFVTSVAADLGDPGVQVLKRMLPVIRQVHLAISTERITAGLDVICMLDGEAPCLAGPYLEVTSPSHLTSYFDGESALTVQLIGMGIRVWTDQLREMPIGEYVGYRYSGPYAEVVFTRRGQYGVPRVTAFPSYFAIPYFRGLRESLEAYGETWARYSSCDILNGAWLDRHRTVFKPGPEILMKKSLQRHLRSALREHSSVMVEQNVNDTRPVDIKITWSTAKRVALIEIKWLGKSARESATHATQNYTASRARDGARQLAVYLDNYHKESPAEEARGYLVVFDGRRRNVFLPPAAPLSATDGTYYRLAEIEYDDVILARPDFDAPIRYFVEPA